MAIRLKIKKAEGDYDLGASKFLGNPVMPESWINKFDSNTIFLLQIRLSDIKDLDETVGFLLWLIYQTNFILIYFSILMVYCERYGSSDYIHERHFPSFFLHKFHRKMNNTFCRLLVHN